MSGPVGPRPPGATLAHMRFRTRLELGGRTATGIEVPAQVVEALGGGKKPAVTVTLNGSTYRSSIGVRDGRYLVPVSAERRAAAGVQAGDEVDVELALDTAPREVEVPPALAEALAASPAAAEAFARLSYSGQLRHALAVDGGKTDETRARRVAAVLAALS